MHTEVNSFFCLKYFLKKDEYFRTFRLIFAYILIQNEFLVTRSDKYNLEGIKEKRVQNLETSLAYAKNGQGQIGIMVQNIDTSNISGVAKTKKGRKYCTFYPNLWLCNSCHTYHLTENTI